MRDQAQRWQVRTHQAEPLPQRATDRLVQGWLCAEQDEGNRRQQVNTLALEITPVVGK